jgi:hypothetical protein
MAAQLTIKQLFLSNNNWWNFYSRHQAKLRKGIVIAVVKLLSCKNIVRGHQKYCCSNPKCSHIKYLVHTCKSKACSSCGKKATEEWITQQNERLPKTSWQHITFTMPKQLWDFFWLNRHLLQPIAKIAADSVKTIAKQKNVIPGIFIAIHTFGRNMGRNVHIHLSTTTGGLSEDLLQWKNLFFDQATLMRIWRYQIIRLFRQAGSQLIIPSNIKKQLNSTFTFNDFLDFLYKKIWIVHCSKPSEDHKITIAYLGRYIKRPPIAQSKLKHYNGQYVTFTYLDHNTKKYCQLKLTPDEFIRRFVQHIPDLGFRMIRYYGFLAHRVVGKLLPIVYQLLGQIITDIPERPTYAKLIQKNFHFNPLLCILCGQPMLLANVYFGKTNTYDLLTIHRQLALLENC